MSPIKPNNEEEAYTLVVEGKKVLIESEKVFDFCEFLESKGIADVTLDFSHKYSKEGYNLVYQTKFFKNGHK